MPRQGSESAAERDALRLRAFLTLAALERDDPRFNAQPLRELVEHTTSVTALRTIAREVRGMVAAMSRGGRADLRRQLEERFGTDAGFERDRRVVDNVRARGRIRTEHEYRVVQAYVDAITADPAAEPESLVLGALLDAYMVGPQLPNER